MKTAALGLALLAAPLAAAVLPSAPAGKLSLRPDPSPVARAYFGVHAHNDAKRDVAWPPRTFGAWRLSDAYVEWPDLEPARGQWDFSLLDRYVDFAGEYDVELLLPLAYSPRWASARPDEPSGHGKPGRAAEPRNLADWRNYVRRVAERYRGRVRYYEIWNEPNTRTLYTGSIKKLVELTRIARETLHAVDPAIRVVSPSFVFYDRGVERLDEFLAAGGGDYVDVIGFHFYVVGRTPEALVPLVQAVRAVMVRHGVDAKPLWNTESGWLIANEHEPVNPVKAGFPRGTEVLSAPLAPAYVARALVLGRALGLERFYWYAWDNAVLGLAEEQGRRPKPAAQAHAQVYRWLQGAVLESCDTQDGQLWICALRRGEARAWLVWHAAHALTWRPPAQWGAVTLETLAGQSPALRDGRVPVGVQPVLVKSAAWRQAALRGGT
jgi:hypothetical protein